MQKLKFLMKSMIHTRIYWYKQMKPASFVTKHTQ